MRKVFILIYLIMFGNLIFGNPSFSSQRKFGTAPIRGWSSWSSFEGDVDEDKVLAAAEIMTKNLKSAGYQYVNVDAGWEKGLDSYGRRQADVKKFPHGMKFVGDAIHSKGLKFGIYCQPGLLKEAWNTNSPIFGTSFTVKQISDGTTDGNTSGNSWSIDFTKPGADAYIQSIVDMFASWGVDYIKMDFVGPGGGNVKADNREELRHWAEAIHKSKRPIWLELSNSLSIDQVDIWRKYSNGWRIGNDIENYGGSTLTSWPHVMERFDTVSQWSLFAGPTAWNDLDSVEIGNGDKDGLTPDERKSCMTLWCISCSPLLLGSDIRSLDADDLKILTNQEVLRIQSAGNPALLISDDTSHQIWRIKNPDGSYIVALFNLGTAATTMSANWTRIGLESSASVRDLWSHQNLGQFDSEWSTSVPAHGVVLLRLSPSRH